MPIRLAIVCSHPVQYYAPWFRYLARNLRAEVRIFYLWNPAADPRHRDPDFAQPVRWDTDLHSGYDHEFVPNKARRPGTSRFSGLYNPGLVGRLRAWRPSVVLQLGYGWRTPLRLTATWRDCPLVLRGDSHDLDRGATLRNRCRAIALRLLFRRYAAFASVGTANRRHYLQHGVDPVRIHHVPHCVDNAVFAAGAADAAGAAGRWRAELGIPPQHRLVLFLGKFIPKKRPDLLIRAFTRAHLPDTMLLLVGSGPLGESLRAAAAGLDSVRFAPFQNQGAIPRTFAAADLLVLPSEGPGETWGLVVNEAMAAGLPCLVSTHVGCREDLISEGATGWSFPAGDETALAHALQSAHAVICDSIQRARLRAGVEQRIASYSYAAATVGLQRLLDAVRPSSESS